MLLHLACGPSQLAYESISTTDPTELLLVVIVMVMQLKCSIKF